MNSTPLRTSPGGIAFIDYAQLLGAPSGTLLRNDVHSLEKLTDFIITQTAGRSSPNTRPRLVYLDQNHTATIVDAITYTGGPADGAYTCSPDIVLLVRTADCFPIIIHDGKTAGLLHVGWRGALAGIIANFFQAVRQFDPAKAKVVIGPGIGPCCFEVSHQVAILFDAKYRLINGGRARIDLPTFIVDELSRYKIRYSFNSNACTVCDPERFYSYRREGSKVKQMLSYVAIGGG